MDVERNLSRMRSIREKAREQGELIRKEKEAKRLTDSIKKHFQTTYIGALSAFEKKFGPRLWSPGVPESELTHEEYGWRKLWEEVRTDILNNGNNERRAAEAELREYSVEWDKHHVDINFNRAD